ncbi:hypothetical protein F4777DRAFT_61107 [Nemania sp. FL0916]|nr:hypothetical protein F4777DRAFT_61107 [Nemania sp. FL0916]
MSSSRLVEVEVTSHAAGNARRPTRPCPPVLWHSVFVGVDPLTATQPIFARIHPRYQKAAEKSLTVRGGPETLGCGSYLEAVSYKQGLQCHFIPGIAMYRPGALAELKKAILTYPLPKSSPSAESIWQGRCGLYTSDLMITQFPLEDVTISAVKWYIDQSLGGKTYFPFDKIPAFPIYPQVQAETNDVGRAMRVAVASVPGEYIPLRRLQYLSKLWAHYQTHPSAHLCFGRVPPEAESSISLRDFVIYVPHVLRAAEESGLAFFPHLACAARHRRDAEKGGRAIPTDKSFETLERLALDACKQEHKAFVPVGHIVPGDLLGTRNAPFADIHCHPAFDSPSREQRTQCIRATVEALGDIQEMCHSPRVDAAAQLSRVVVADAHTKGRAVAREELQTLREERLKEGIHVLYPGMGDPYFDERLRRPNLATSYLNEWKASSGSPPPPPPPPPSSPPSSSPPSSSPPPPPAAFLSTSQAARPDASSLGLPRPPQPHERMSPRLRAAWLAVLQGIAKRDSLLLSSATASFISRQDDDPGPATPASPLLRADRGAALRRQMDRQELEARYRRSGAPGPPVPTGRPGSRRAPGETRSQRRRANRDARQGPQENDSSDDDSIPRIGRVMQMQPSEPEPGHTVGLPASAIAGLPRSTVGPGTAFSKDQQCVICMDPYLAGDNLTILPCAHGFHADCVGEWLARKASCPTCRQTVNIL